MKKYGTSFKPAIFFSARAAMFFSVIIQRLSKSAWSHVAIVYKYVELNRVMILESEPRIGIRLISLSKYMRAYKGTKRAYKGQIIIAKLNFELEHEKLNKAICFGLDELTRPYDNWEIIRIMTRILFRIGKKEKKLYLLRIGEGCICKSRCRIPAK